MSSVPPKMGADGPWGLINSGKAAEGEHGGRKAQLGYFGGG